MKRMDKASHNSYLIALLAIPGWIFVSLTNLLFSFIFKEDFIFIPFILIYIPIFSLFLNLLFIRLSILNLFLSGRKKALHSTLLLFVFINGVLATYICANQPNAYNGYSVLFIFLIGIAFLNRVLGLKGTIFVCGFFFFLFIFILNLSDLPFGQDEKLLCYFYGYTAIIFGYLNESTIRHLKKEMKLKKIQNMLEIEKIASEDFCDHHYKQTMTLKNLLSNLEQGYLTFNAKGIIHEGATKITEVLLETSLFQSEVEGFKIWDILFKEQSKKDNFKKWVNKTFEGRLLFRDLKQLAPKTFQGTKGRHILLDFRPIYEEKSKRKIVKVIMIAADKTQEVALERQLELDKQEADFVKTCLQNPVEFQDLLSDTLETLDSYTILKTSKEACFRRFHTLKARYGQFGIKTLTFFINEIEIAISEQEFDKMDSSVDEFKLELQEFIKKNNLIVEASKKFMVDKGHAMQVSEVMEKIKASESLEDLEFDIYKNYLLSDIKEKFERYRPLVDELAEKQGKVIDVEFLGEKILVEYAKFSDFVNVSVHLFRNMVDHGIETEDERIEKTKPQRGSIKVEFKNNGDSFFIHMTDDGGGIDPERIKDKILEKGLKSEEELKDLKDSDFVDMIFLPGFSTKEEVTDVSGRGVGMDAVRASVEGLGGTISVSSKIDEGTKFTIELPVLS